MARTRSRRPKSVRKSRSTLHVAEEKNYTKSPHSFVFARSNVGSLVKQLSLDFRRTFEPYTASHLQVSKKNVLKDFITIAGPLNVSHILYFTHPRPEYLAAKRTRHAINVEKKKEKMKLKTEEQGEEDTQSSSQGGVYMHLVRSPNGPSLTFRVLEYSLVKDVFNLVRRVFDNRQFTKPPLLAMTGFSGPVLANGSREPPPPHARLVVDMFQNMLPPLNIQKLKLSSVRRVLLLSREVDSESSEEVIYVRHFNIRIENRTISKALRRLGVGGAPLRKRLRPDMPGGGVGPGGSGKTSGVPSLGKYVTIDDYLTKTSLLTDSGMSDLEDMAEVELPGGPVSDMAVHDEDDNQAAGGQPLLKKKKKEALAEAKAAHGFSHLSGCRKATIRLTEIGPRLTLKLIKIEEGINSGSVLYHSWHKKSQMEISRQEEMRRQKEAGKAARRAIQEKRRLANEAVKDLHRRSCLEGQQRAEAEKLKEEGAEDENDEGEVPAEAKADFDQLMRQMSDAEEEQSKPERPIKSGRVNKAKNKKKNKPKLTRKHPAYKYLMEKAEIANQKRKEQGRR